jgi:hypothetical protein
MIRFRFLLAAAGVLLLVVWGWYKLGRTSALNKEAAPLSIDHVKSADPLDTPAGWRYRQNMPRHWRYIMLQK